MANIEDLTFKTQNNASVVDLSAMDAATYTITGDQDLTVTAVKEGLTTVDASALTGAMTIDTTGVTSPASIKSITTGTGDDTITADANELVANASISGGAGADTLKLSDSAAAGSTVQTAMSGIETLEVTAITAGQTLTMSTKNVSDLATIQLDANGTNKGALNVVSLGSRDVTLKTVGAMNTAQDVTLDTTGTVSVDLTAKAASTAKANTGVAFDGSEAVVNDVNLTNAASVNVTVGDYISYTGATTGITASKATDVSLTVNSAMNSATTPTEQTRFNADLDAAKATTVTINSHGQTTLTNGSDLTAAQVVTVTADDAVVMTSATLGAASTITLSGTEKESAVSLGIIGTDGTTAVDYNVNVTASGLKAGLTLGAISSQQDATVTVEGTTGTVTLDDITAANVTVNAANLADVLSTANGGDINSTTADTGTATVTVSNAAKDITVGAIGTTKSFKTVTVDATSNTSTVNLGAITAKDSASVDFTGSLSTVTVGAISAKAVTVNASDVLKAVTIGGATNGGAADITITDSLTYTAGLVGANGTPTNGVEVAVTTAATDTTVTLNGNLGNDKFTITTGDYAANAKLTVKGDLDIGTNSVTINAVAENTTTEDLTINLANLKSAGTTTISVVGGAGDDTITGTEKSDQIEGGTGNDTLDGGKGSDVYVVGNISADTDKVKDSGATSDTDMIKVTNTGETLAGFTSDGTKTLIKTDMGIEALVITAGQNVTVNGDQVTGESLIVNATGTGATTLNVTAENGATTDLSSLVFTDMDGTENSFDAFTSGTDIIAVTADNPLSGTTGATIKGATIATIVNSGTGNDDITFASNGIDKVSYVGAADGVDGSDTIKDFTAGAAGDIFDIGAKGTTNIRSTSTSTADIGAHTLGTTDDVASGKYVNNFTDTTSNAMTIATGKHVVEIAAAEGLIADTGTDGINEVDFRAKFGAGATGSGADKITFSANDKGAGFFTVYDSTSTTTANAYLFYVDIAKHTDTAKTIGASDTVKLIGTFEGVGANTFTDANFF